MKIQNLNIDKIKLAEYNPRKIDNKAFLGLCESIKKFGLQQPLIVNKNTGNLVSGHQRVAACKHLGIKEVPVVYVALTDIEEKAMNVTMNNKAIEGDFTEGLKDILAEIQESLGNDYIFDLNLDDILKDIPNEHDDEPFEPEEPEREPEKYKITIICKDSLEKSELLSEFMERDITAY